MVTCKICTADKHIDSKFVSIQQEHVRLYVDGKLFSVELYDFQRNFIKEYKDFELSKLIGSAIAKGRRVGNNRTTGEPEFYYLGDR